MTMNNEMSQNNSKYAVSVYEKENVMCKVMGILNKYVKEKEERN